MKINHLITGMAVVLTSLGGMAQTISTEYAQPGIGGQILKEFIDNELVDVLDLPINSKLNEAGKTTDERVKWLNNQNAGAQIVNAYISDVTTFEKMRSDAQKSLTQADLDMQMLSGLGEDMMINNIITRRLNNNYVIFVDDLENGKKGWELYKIDLTPELYNAYINTLGTNEAAPQINMKFIKSGNYKQSDIDNEYSNAINDQKPENGYAVFRRLTRDVPDLSIGGPVINSHPFRARMPKATKSSKLQRFYLYRTVEKNGVLKSKNIGTAYVTRVMGDTIQLYSLFGRTGNKKRGDYAVLTPGGRSAFSITGMYGLEKEGNYPRVRVEYDYLHWISPIGLTGHVLGSLDADFIGKSKSDFVGDKEVSYVNVSDNKAYISNPNPLRVGLGVGYGVAYNFMGRFSIMPYARVAGTYNTFLSLSNKDEDLIGPANVKGGAYLPVTDSYGNLDLSENNKADFFGIRGDLGFKFQINFTNKLSMFVGAEYNYFHGFGKKTTADITAAEYFYDKEYLDHGKSAINFQLGFRLISF